MKPKKPTQQDYQQLMAALGPQQQEQLARQQQMSARTFIELFQQDDKVETDNVEFLLNQTWMKCLEEIEKQEDIFCLALFKQDDNVTRKDAKRKFVDKINEHYKK